MRLVENEMNKLAEPLGENPDAEELLKVEEVEGTPFNIIGVLEGEDYRFFGAMGKYRITEPGEPDELRKELKTVTWDRIVQVVGIMIENRHLILNNEEK